MFFPLVVGNHCCRALCTLPLYDTVSCFDLTECSKGTIGTLALMDLEKINYDLVLELLEWIVTGDHEVRNYRVRSYSFREDKL